MILLLFALIEIFGQEERPLFLLTAFEKFEGRKTNRSELLLNKIREEYYPVNPLYELVTCVLPVISPWSSTSQCVEAQKKQPLAILSFGEAALGSFTTPWIQFETIAVNAWRAPGRVGNSKSLENLGDSSVASRFPYQEFFAVSSKQELVKLKLSTNAGLYSCNEVFYRMMRLYATSETRVGFGHVSSSAGDRTIEDLARVILRGLDQIAISQAEHKPSPFPHFSNDRRHSLSRSEQKLTFGGIDKKELDEGDLDFYRKLMRLSFSVGED